MKKLKVLVTGATGNMAGQLLPAFREKYDLRLIDVRAENKDGKRVEDVEIVDLLIAEQTELEPYFRGIDVVVHMAYKPPSAGEGHTHQFKEEQLNIDMIQRVFQLSLDCGVRRVVAASSNQAAKWYEQPYFDMKKDMVTTDDYPRPDNFYGWSKAAYESLGFLYACGSLGRSLEMVLLRLVVPREINPEHFVDQPKKRYIRELAGYISERDHQQLFCKSIETVDIKDSYGIPFQIFNGVSNNTRKFWSITNARNVIDYQPTDDSEVQFASDIDKLLNPNRK